MKVVCSICELLDRIEDALESLERGEHRHSHEKHRRPKRQAKMRLTFGNTVVSFTGDFSMKVPDSGGPFVALVSGFLDAASQPTTDVDAPVWASSDPSIATVVADPTNPQQATVTLTKAIGQAQITATFGDPAASGFVVTGALEVTGGPATQAVMQFTGPGV